LDLSYITPRLLAMAAPCEGNEAFYRNPMAKVVKFLHAFHPVSLIISVPAGKEEEQSVATPHAARGWSHPLCRPFKTQSCCCLGSSFESSWCLPQPLDPSLRHVAEGARLEGGACCALTASYAGADVAGLCIRWGGSQGVCRVYDLRREQQYPEEHFEGECLLRPLGMPIGSLTCNRCLNRVLNIQ
jgi:hypothetical protein